MLDGLKRLFSRPAAAPPAWDPAVVWAERHGHVFRPVKDEGGFVVDGQAGSLAWRLEWGPSQRPYVQGNELRLRSDAALPADIQAMVLDRPLQLTMEQSVFDQYVEGVQTRIDNTTPPEMRWLVMLTKLSGNELGALRERFAAVGSSTNWLMHWLHGPLAQALLAAPLVPGQPMVLMVARGRVTLRAGLGELSGAALDDWLRLFSVALREARRAAEQSAAATGAASTRPSLWAPDAMPPGAPEAPETDPEPPR